MYFDTYWFSDRFLNGIYFPIFMDDKYVNLLEKQGYRFTGNNSAIKICDWTRKSLRGEGTCYKEKFYGIKSHQCCQISLAVNYCDKDCLYCWRARENFPFLGVDEPADVLEKANHFQKKLLEGFKGLRGIDMKRFAESSEITSFAISLTGESLYYPKLNEFIKLARNAGKNVFFVTHGGYPTALNKIEAPTQLYLSMDAPNKELFDILQRSKDKDAWKKYLESLKILEKLKSKTRTAVRLTLIYNMNMFDLEGYAKLIGIAQPNFIEVKSYMWMGYSKTKLLPRNSPFHSEIQEFCEKLVKLIPYKIADEQEVSRVVLLQRKGEKINRKLPF